MHTRIFLIGFMGSGKTTHGKRLATRLDYAFVDMDRYIEEKAGATIPEIFSDKGEAAFRDMETAAIRELCQHENTVIATGGGAPAM